MIVEKNDYIVIKDKALKILIIDDSLLDRKLLMSLLTKSGVKNEILQAPDGDEGLKILSENYQNIALILLDWQMPKLDGIGFMKAVVNVKEVASIPIVMITASGSEENKRLAREVNPHLAGYLIKPFNSEKLLELITPFVQREG